MTHQICSTKYGVATFQSYPTPSHPFARVPARLSEAKQALQWCGVEWEELGFGGFRIADSGGMLVLGNLVGKSCIYSVSTLVTYLGLGYLGMVVGFYKKKKKKTILGGFSRSEAIS